MTHPTQACSQNEPYLSSKADQLVQWFYLLSCQRCRAKNRSERLQRDIAAATKSPKENYQFYAHYWLRPLLCVFCVGCWVHSLPPLSSSRSIRTRNSRATPQCCICRCIIEWGGGRRAIECAPNCTLWSAINGNETMVVRLRVDTLTGRTSVRHPAIRGDRGGWLGWIDCKYASHVASLCRCVQCLNVAKPRSPLKRNRPHHWIENRLRFFSREGMVGTRKKKTNGPNVLVCCFVSRHWIDRYNLSCVIAIVDCVQIMLRSFLSTVMLWRLICTVSNFITFNGNSSRMFSWRWWFLERLKRLGLDYYSGFGTYFRCLLLAIFWFYFMSRIIYPVSF